MEQLLDVLLQVAGHADVVGEDLDGFRFQEQHMPLPGRRPQHSPVAGAGDEALAAVLRQADERVLAGHDDVVRIDHLLYGWCGHGSPSTLSAPAALRAARRAASSSDRCRTRDARSWSRYAR